MVHAYRDNKSQILGLVDMIDLLLMGAKTWPVTGKIAD